MCHISSNIKENLYSDTKKIMVLTNLCPVVLAKHSVHPFFGKQRRKNCFLEVLPRRLLTVVWHHLVARILKIKTEGHF